MIRHRLPRHHAPTARRAGRGFTMIEVVIVAAIIAIFVVLVVPPLLDAITLSARENAKLRMDRDANRALSQISEHLRPAVLPIVTRNSIATSASATQDWTGEQGQISFQQIINSWAGFRTFGAAWQTILMNGTDFIPFAKPVPYIYNSGSITGETLDSNFLPQLGITSPNGQITNAIRLQAASDTTVPGAAVVTHPPRYFNYSADPNADASTYRYYHPALSRLDPTAWGVATLPPPLDEDGNNAASGNIVLTDNHYAATLQTPAPTGNHFGYGIIRFVPFRESGGAIRTITEGQVGWDLNDNQSYADSYALGKLEIVYMTMPLDNNGVPIANTATPVIRTETVSSNTVLLQLNVGAVAGYEPLFRLRRLPVDANDNPVEDANCILDISLLLMDDLRQQRSILGFGKTVPFIVRRYKASVELRNMSLE